MSDAFSVTPQTLEQTLENTASSSLDSVSSEGVSASSDVWMFSGQGSQQPGMGADLLPLPEVAEMFACASDIVGVDVARLCLSASAEELSQTKNAQISLVTLSLALISVCKNRGCVPRAVLGFSLGQMSALYAADMLSAPQVFSLVCARADAMRKAAEANNGAMTAVLRLDPAQVEKACQHVAEGQILVPANYNSAAQTVVSGEADAIARFEEYLQEQKVRCARLATQGAFHSPLMAEAAEEFEHALASYTFAEPSIPLICNVDARPLSAASAACHLKRHLVSPVLFHQSVDTMLHEGCSFFVEMGFGGVLINLVKRISKETAQTGVFDKEGLERYLARCGTSL